MVARPLGNVLALICLIGLLFSPAVSAQLGLDTGSKKDSTTKSEAVNKEMEVLQSELKHLEQQNQSLKNDKQALNAEVQGAPELAKQLRGEIRRLESGKQQSDIPDSRSALQSAIKVLDGQAKALQLGLSSVLDKVGDLQSLPSKARADVLESQKLIKEAGDEINQLESGKSSSLKTMQIAVLNQKISNAMLKKSLAQNRLEGYQELLDLYTVNRDLLLLQLDIVKAALETLRSKRDELRQNAADESQDETIQISSHYDVVPEVLGQAQKENRNLAEKLERVTESLTESSDNLADGKQELQEIRYRAEMAKQQLELTGISENVDDYLMRQRQMLQVHIREFEGNDELSDRISKARLDQFKLDEKLHDVRTEASRNRLIRSKLVDHKLEEAQAEQVQQDLLKLYLAREDILTNLVKVNADYVVSLTNLEILYQDQYNARKSFYKLLNQELFWRRSAAPVNMKWLRAVPDSVSWFLLEHDWREPLDIWYRNLVKPVVPLFFTLLVLGVLVWVRKRLCLRLKRVSEKIGNVTRDKFRYTVESLLVTVVLALPVPVVLSTLGVALVLSTGSSLFAEGVGRALIMIGRWYFFFELIRQLCRPHGLARAHFHWRVESVKALRRCLPWLYLQLPWTFVFIVVWREGNDFHSGVLGRASFIMALFFFFLFCLRVFNTRNGVFQHGEAGPSNRFQQWNKGLFWAAVLVPVLLLLLSLQGFSFTAMELMVLLYYSFMTGFLILVIDQVLHRWFSIVERKLAYKRALEKRDAMRKAKEMQEASKSSGEAVPELEMPNLELDTISEQNRALLRVFSLSLFVFACYWIWRDFFQAAQIFQEVSLWSYNVETEVGTETRNVALGTLLLTLLVLVATYMGVKNLPGLIEVMILQRFHFDQGIRFAITSTARYVVIGVGIMLASGYLGLDWSKLGWLVAALGVGLGFGLQEIFANFISGLIILYERPIRIGDTVTINDLSGTVAKINMRATTITDWDRKELIIPNKTFVTTQFINWTLSDSTTRLVVKVGVAYGSDTQKAIDILLDVARRHPSVLDDPAPSAFFLTFGASSLDLELRVFVANFGDRLSLLHALNTEIDRRFKEAGIEIAFPQMDIHVRDIAPPSQPSPDEGKPRDDAG